jgi:enterochelin esterase-like enzyme
MSVTRDAARPQVWLDTLGDWSWPGTKPQASEMMPPAWVPARPPHVQAIAGGAGAVAVPQRRGAWRIILGILLSAIAALATGIAIEGPAKLERLAGLRSNPAPAAARFAPGPPPSSLPTLVPQSTDAAGSSIDSATYSSPELGRNGLFYVYLPPGFSTSMRRYPVIYLLPGNSQPAEAFLQIGVQGALDQLITSHKIAPMIAVMIHGGPGANNWHNVGRTHYENYVLEVQQLVDRMLPTIAARPARAIAGDSMGGYGAMNIALGNPFRFGVVESWLGFFNGLSSKLHADRDVFTQLGLRAYVYGAQDDKIADPSENAPFAAELRANGATAHSAIVPGEHSLTTVEAHLSSMLTYAGRALAAEVAAAQAKPSAAPAASAAHAHARS